jgi:hypothetical protein
MIADKGGPTAWKELRTTAREKGGADFQSFRFDIGKCVET